MRTAQCSLDIHRTPEDLHAFMLDLRNAPQWGELIHRMEWIDGGPHAGARIRLHFWLEGREQVQEATLAEWEPGRRHVTINDSEPGYHCAFSYDLAPISTGTRVTISSHVTGRTLAHRLLLPMFRKRHRLRFTRALERLKAAAEQAR